RTCEDTGFLVVANHGVDPALPAAVFAQAARFFARSEEEKLPYKVGRYNIGYLPFGAQVVRHSPVNNNTRPNFSESFYVTRGRAPAPPEHPRLAPAGGAPPRPGARARFPRGGAPFSPPGEGVPRRPGAAFPPPARPAEIFFSRPFPRPNLHAPADPLPAAP